ncbi:MAG: hypothetical protein KVP17_003210 [Porospora cf. gigantea B]|uniref:uncharacterized protein n=1 Tax=Porospora cf. gigantea B TaxID=2853592 RepID=UPI003571A5F0|nr:MAG: hypothetical protein KVP17_003210 [Porospora cf. gigantea B]
MIGRRLAVCHAPTTGEFSAWFDSVPPTGNAGTVRWAGELQCVEWMGIEWDDCRRGKNDGCARGQRLFWPEGRLARHYAKLGGYIYSAATSCSFIRTESIRADLHKLTGDTRSVACAGDDLMEALVRRYCTPCVPDESVVQFVGVLAATEHFSQWEDLPFLGLLNSCVTCALDVPPLKAKAFSLNGNRLLSSWTVPLTILQKSSDLTELDLSGCPGLHTADFTSWPQYLTFPSLQRLNLSGSPLLSPECVSELLCRLPGLKQLLLDEIGWDTMPDRLAPHGLESLSLSGNWLDSGPGRLTSGFVGSFPRLTTLNLNHSKVFHRFSNANDWPPIPRITDLSLDSACIFTWADVEKLAAGFPNLHTLRAQHMPLTGSETCDCGTRGPVRSSLPLQKVLEQTCITLWPHLQSYNGGQVSRRLREDAERWFANLFVFSSPLVQDFATADNLKTRLEAKFGDLSPTAPSTCMTSASLAASLITVTLEPGLTLPDGRVYTKKLLPSMPLRDLKTLCAGVFGLPSSSGMSLLCQDDMGFLELEMGTTLGDSCSTRSLRIRVDMRATISDREIS